MPTTLVLRFPRGQVDLPPSPWRLLRALHAVWRTRAPELGEDTMHALLARLAEPPTFHVPQHGMSELAVHWPFELTMPQRSALERLASSIPYLGRADSLCSGRVPREWEPGAHETWVPVDVAESVAEDASVTAVLAPELPLRLNALLARPVEVGKGSQVRATSARLRLHHLKQGQYVRSYR